MINPGAGQRAAAKVRPLAAELFPAKSWDLEFVELRTWRDIRPLATRAVKARAYAVVAVGGDGTINQAAPALVGSRTRLGIIPAGTGNGFARALGVPLNAGAALRSLAQGSVRAIDYGAMDLGRGYANMLGLGWDAWIAVRANDLRWLNRISGFLRYVGAALLSVDKLGTQKLSLRIDGKLVEGDFFGVAVANSPQYGFGCTIAPMAKMDDGKFDVVCLPAIGPWAFARNAVRLFTQRPLLGATFYRARTVTVRSAASQEWPLHLDGEPGGTTPFTVTVKPRALQVLVP